MDYMFYIRKYISSVLISTVFSVTASVVIYMIVLLIMKNQAVKLVLEILHIKNNFVFFTHENTAGGCF